MSGEGVNWVFGVGGCWWRVSSCMCGACVRVCRLCGVGDDFVRPFLCVHFVTPLVHFVCAALRKLWIRRK